MENNIINQAVASEVATLIARQQHGYSELSDKNHQQQLVALFLNMSAWQSGSYAERCELTAQINKQLAELATASQLHADALVSTFQYQDITTQVESLQEQAAALSNVIDKGATEIRQAAKSQRQADNMQARVDAARDNMLAAKGTSVESQLTEVYNILSAEQQQLWDVEHPNGHELEDKWHELQTVNKQLAELKGEEFNAEQMPDFDRVWNTQLHSYTNSIAVNRPASAAMQEGGI